MWEAAFKEAIEGHSRSSKLQFLGWLEARGTLSTQEGDTPDVTLVENISPGAEEVGGDGAMEMAARKDISSEVFNIKDKDQEKEVLCT